MPITISPDFRKRVRGASLLAMPQSAVRVVALSKDPDSGPPEYAKVIALDAGLSTQVLRFVNSPLVRPRHPVATVQQAVAFLPLKTLRSFILLNAVFAAIPDPKIGGFLLRILYQDSLRRGMFVRELVDALRLRELDAEELFLCGLFQDIALPIISQTWVNEYRLARSHVATTHQRLSSLEREIFPWDHGLAGGYFVSEWGLGDEMGEIITAHVNPPEGDLLTPLSWKRHLVALSALLPSVGESEWHDAKVFLNGLGDVLDARPRTAFDLVPFFNRVDERAAELYAVMNFAPPPQSLAQAYEEYCNGS